MADTATATAGPLTVVTCPVEIDMATAGATGEQVAAALAPGVHAVIADMTATTFCDSAGINMLIRVKKQATAHGARSAAPTGSDAAARHRSPRPNGHL